MQFVRLFHSILFCSTLLLVEVNATQDFVPNESLVTSQPDIIDFEFNESRAQFIWFDMDGRLWIGNIDRVTGMFDPLDGKGILVDTRAPTTAEALRVPTNGPEWISTSTGEQIVYTKFLPIGQHTATNARLALAEEQPNGTWSVRYLSRNLPRNAPYSSSDPADTRPRITYVDNLGNHYWREIYDAATEELMPFVKPGKRSVRFVRGARAVVFAAPINQVQQVVRYDLDMKTLEQLTFDAGNKDLGTVPWMWQAPELNNEFIFFTVINNVELRVYRKLPVPGSQEEKWTPIYSVPFPAGTDIKSPEPFIYQGKSYVYFCTATVPKTYASVVWLSNIDAANPLLRQVTDDTLLRQRSDPEVFFTSQGPFIYYNRTDRETFPMKQEGVFRASIGLPPPENMSESDQ